eukprot:gene43588-17813_t
MPLAAKMHGHATAKGLLKSGGLHGIHHTGNVVPHPKQGGAGPARA